MTKQIRQAVFETNSSSTHSISVASGPTEGILLDTIGVIDVDGVPTVVVPPGEFGWEVEDYNDAPTKASYAAIYARDWSGGRSEEFFDILTKVIEDQTGCDHVVYNLGDDCWGSYIDHQSVECGELDYLFDDPEALRQFIFNRNSTLHTDNDNY
jgi:hypothetical protein